MTDVEKVARAICPLVKPWLDGEDVPPGPCCCAGIVETPFGKGKTACFAICEDIAKAAIAACNEWLPIEELPDEIKREGTWFLADWGGRVIYTSWLDNSDKTPPWAGFRVPSMMSRPSGNPTRFRLIEGPGE